MQMSRYAFIYALCAFTTAWAGVHEIPSSNQLEEFIKKHPQIVVEFSTDWCGFCQIIDPHYKQLADDPAARGYVLAHIDGDQNGNAVRKYAADGSKVAYPTFVFFKDGKKVHKQVGITGEEDTFASDMLATMKQHLGAPKGKAAAPQPKKAKGKMKTKKVKTKKTKKMKYGK